VPLVLIFLAIPFLFSIILGILDGFAFAAIRSILNYAGLFFIPYATYLILKKNQGFSQKNLIIIILIWLGVAIIQSYIYPSFLSFILPRSGSSFMGRGVTSLAPEPSHFGMQFLMLFIFSYLNNPKDKWGLLLSMIGIFFFAKSSFTLFIIMLLIIYYSIVYFSLNSLLVTIFMFFTGIQFIEIFQKGTRLYKLSHLFFKKPVEIFFLDYSATVRFLNIYFSFRGFFENYFLPRGFIENWRIYIGNSLPVFIDLFTKYTDFPLIFINFIHKDIGDDAKIFGGLGSSLFELGFVGLLIPICILIIMSCFTKGN